MLPPLRWFLPGPVRSVPRTIKIGLPRSCTASPASWMVTDSLFAMFATDYNERWEERTYDLSQLRSLDLFLVYWMGPSIAHTIMSFGFDDGRHLDFSIELRRTQNDQYSAVAGFFKTHELVFIGADERDLMTLRKARQEQIQLYRLRTPPERARALLVEYIKQANDLSANPRF